MASVVGNWPSGLYLVPPLGLTRQEPIQKVHECLIAPHGVRAEVVKDAAAASKTKKGKK